MEVKHGACSSGTYANTGNGPSFSVLDVGLKDMVAVVEGDTAFWAVVAKESLEDALSGRLVEEFHRHVEKFHEEMDLLRAGLKPSAVYFNPTERCNFDCSYCYLPREMRRNGKTMRFAEVSEALDRILEEFQRILPEGVRPQIVFHGSEPMLARDAVFEAIERYRDRFDFGIQTNATLLDREAVDFLMGHGVAVGISLDAPDAASADAVRKNWKGQGAFDSVVRVMRRLAGYPGFSVISTVTKLNVDRLPKMVDFFHEAGVGVVMFNPVRCTQDGGRALKPDNDLFSRLFIQALDRTELLYRKTGRKLVVANFANVLAGIVAPTGRRLMCDISPCGAGRCFVAVSAHGDVFPCSEFIGFPEFRGGNLYTDSLAAILSSPPFHAVTSRKVERIVPCARCAIRHFCGAPCPAEVHAVSKTLDAPSPYCGFYEEQVRYAFRVLASGREDAYLWDDWEEETEECFRCA